jgi:cyclophilin family peptidyl-prolyl cis-trans isomerase
MSNIIFRQATVPAVWIAVFLFSIGNGFAQYTNGIYAEFNTSMGSYTCALYYAESPKAVGNLIGLASGQRAWLDLPSGVVKTNPFYNGITFHRVITNFVIQAGSPNGLGTDGPGYAFVDEITNTLRFDSFGVLAMANSGTNSDSNGAQFFVTAAPQPGLNGGYTIFGRLYGGSNVVYAINRVATDTNSKPLVNVTIGSIAIRRIGSAANAFDINAQGLPLVTNLDLNIATSGTNVNLTFNNQLYADNRLYGSSNLFNWASHQLGIETAAPVSNTNVQSTLAPAQFFRAAQIQYAASTRAPKSVSGKAITLVFASGYSGTNTIAFDSAGGGTYNWSGASGTLTGYNWVQAPYNGRFLPIGFSAPSSAVITVFMHYTTVMMGTFTGTAYYIYPFIALGPVSGTFTSTP